MIIYTLYDYFKLYPYVIKQRNYRLNDSSQSYRLEVSNSKKEKQYHIWIFYHTSVCLATKKKPPDKRDSLSSPGDKRCLKDSNLLTVPGDLRFRGGCNANSAKTAYQQFYNTIFLFIYQEKFAGQDSNLRSPGTTDLQSAYFSLLHTDDGDA